MSKTEILDNYHYLSIMLAVAEASPKLNIARFLPPENNHSCLWIFSDDGKINITLDLRTCPKSPTQYQSEVYSLVDYAYQNDNLIKHKIHKPTTNDYLLFCRTVDMANARLDYYNALINQAKTEKDLDRLIIELNAPTELLKTEMQNLIKKNSIVAVGREGAAIRTAYSIAYDLFNDNFGSVYIGELKDAIIKELLKVPLSKEKITQMFEQTENTPKTLS